MLANFPGWTSRSANIVHRNENRESKENLSGCLTDTGKKDLHLTGVPPEIHYPANPEEPKIDRVDCRDRERQEREEIDEGIYRYPVTEPVYIRGRVPVQIPRQRKYSMVKMAIVTSSLRVKILRTAGISRL